MFTDLVDDIPHEANGIKPKLFSQISTSLVKHPARSAYDDALEAADYLRSRTNHRPKIAIICGSGLGPMADAVKNADSFDFKEIPHFAVSTVPGHTGRLIFGEFEHTTVLCMQGRVHSYEGYSQWKVAFPVRVMKILGIQVLIASNAAGALNPEYQEGDIMILKDHINIPGLCGLGPLVGPNDERFGPRFIATSKCYDKELREITKAMAQRLGFNFIREGVYVIQGGPCFESVSECKMLRILGADVTGMSTVPEVTVAVHCGIKCMAFSLVTNKCITEFDVKEVANHEEVLEVGQKRSSDLIHLIQAIVPEINCD